MILNIEYEYDEYFDEDVGHADPLDADPVGDGEGDDEYFDIS